MSDLDKVLQWFESGRLLRPSSAEPNFVDLVRALARHAGVARVPGGPGVESLASEIGPAETWLFVLVDAMGSFEVDRLPGDTFLRRTRRLDLQSVFLSTTACALSTLASGEWPARHAVPGWWAYLEEQKLDIVTLPFVERGTGRALEELGVSIDALCPLPSIWERAGEGVTNLVPAPYVDSVYTSYLAGRALRLGYEDADEAIGMAEEIARRRGSRLVYLYLPQYDAAAHEKGTDDESVRALLASLDEKLGALADRLRGVATMVVSADHGQVNTPDSQRIHLSPDDELLEMLATVPSAEMTVPFFHVKPGEEQRFGELFRKRLGDRFALLSVDEVERLELLGPGPLSPTMRRRVGSFVGIAAEPVQLHAAAPRLDAPSFVGVHGGLRPQEMRIPLVVS